MNIIRWENPKEKLLPTDLSDRLVESFCSLPSSLLTITTEFSFLSMILIWLSILFNVYFLLERFGGLCNFFLYFFFSIFIWLFPLDFLQFDWAGGSWFYEFDMYDYDLFDSLFYSEAIFDLAGEVNSKQLGTFAAIAL